MDIIFFLIVCFVVYSALYPKPKEEFVSVTIKEGPQKKIKRQYNPQSFEEYIGQKKAKTILKSYIKGVVEGKKQHPHLLIHGEPGCGKTTLARIFTKEYAKLLLNDLGYYECIATTIPNVEYLVEIINRVDGGVVILDEVHALSRDVAEHMYTILTDFNYNGIELVPFTMIGCTTEYGEMIEKMEPFVQRFPLQIQLDGYTQEDITHILEQLRENEFQDLNRDLTYIYKTIAENCRNTPRIAISYLRSTYYLGGNVDSTLYNQNVIYKGFTKNDYKILDCLEKSKVAGIQAVCSYLGTSKKNYQHQEAFLFKEGLIGRTPRGRILTDKGKEVLGILNEKILVDN